MNIFRLFESKKLMKICSKTHQIAPFKKIFWEIYLMINFLQAPKKVPPPLANPAYAHIYGLLLKNLFEEVHS